jgi:hypothetical protein
MDNREAKFILNAYRPAGQDASDPRFSEALEQARRDPSLQRWLEQSVAFDTAMAEGLRAVEVPPDLRENILAGVKVSRPLRWRNPFFIKWAIAAALVLSAALGSLIWHNTRPAHLVGWQNQALAVISSLVKNESSFDVQSHNPAELVSWLHSKGVPAAQTLPPDLEKLESLGCKTFSWNGTPVSVICLMRPDGGLIHFVATAATPATDHIGKLKPRLLRQGKWTTATWREGDKIYMLALEGSPEQLRPYLS